MIITREKIIHELSDKCQFYQRDIRVLLRGLDEIVKEHFSEVTDDEEVVLQLVEGIKVGFKVVPERQRKNPATGEDVVCSPTCKPFTKFSMPLRDSIQEAYENRKKTSKET
jgi:nucleoid DNA-binding protein